MAVITGDGIVGKVREVFPRTAQVLLVNDQTSGAGVILETTRTRGILRGNAAGQLQIIGILADQRIQPGEKVLTAGGDQIFPRGLPVGVVEKVVRDPERDAFIDIIVKPAAHLDRLDEVVVITSTTPKLSPEQQQDLATSEALKGPEVELAKEQKKAAEIMAERLPTLIDPKLPPDQQPLHDNSLPTSVGRVPQPLHPDRFTPGSATTPDLSAGKPDNTQQQPAPAKPQSQKAPGANSATPGQPAKKSGPTPPANPPGTPAATQTKTVRKPGDPAPRNP
jgi:rod shape-determining protein MreC